MNASRSFGRALSQECQLWESGRQKCSFMANTWKQVRDRRGGEKGHLI